MSRSADSKEGKIRMTVSRLRIASMRRSTLFEVRSVWGPKPPPILRRRRQDSGCILEAGLQDVQGLIGFALQFGTDRVDSFSHLFWRAGLGHPVKDLVAKCRR